MCLRVNESVWVCFGACVCLSYVMFPINDTPYTLNVASHVIKLFQCLRITTYSSRILLRMFYNMHQFHWVFHFQKYVFILPCVESRFMWQIYNLLRILHIMYRSCWVVCHAFLNMQVTIIWAGHFANIVHHTQHLLDGITSHSPPLHAGFEERTGQPPNTLSMEVCKCTPLATTAQ